ncbi:DUF3800 domain-containing protein [Rhodobacteraceae bacterium WD3A24]|nr:DUF3800 domain-containing protein [Rhodobacteraceae bacterium WD3A24]
MRVTYIAYLDEFGHVGPFVSRANAKHNDSPVFGLAGYVLPSNHVRSFGTWFFKRKCELLDFEIRRSGLHPAVWEKKGASLYTAKNVERYRELRQFTFRLFNKINKLSGFAFYVGIRKTADPADHNPNRMYGKVLLEAIKRIDEFCEVDCGGADNFLLALDEHEQRSELITQAAKNMYGTETPRRRLIEPPFHLESHRYQTVQAADWIAGLVGRLGAVWSNPEDYDENNVFRKYFERRLNEASVRSGIRS